MIKKYMAVLWAYLLKRFLFILKFLPLKHSICIMGFIANFLGRLSSRHKLIINNLKNAYPGKNIHEINNIAKKMWHHMGALLIEYFLISKIVDNPQNVKRCVIIENVKVLEQVSKENKPHIFFTAHIGNFELLPILAQQHNVDMAVLFRPPNNKYVAKMLLKIRKKFLPHIVPSTYGAAWQLTKALSTNKNIGILVDQKYSSGFLTSFFNQPVKTNPLAIKLADKFNCDLYPAICLRLPKGKYKIILYEKLSLIRDKNGIVDFKANCQMLNDIVEQWVRENPEQWMWFHNRWKV